MADDLTQSEADALRAMEKLAADKEVRTYPRPGEAMTAPLVSLDGREEFLLDVTRGQIGLKVSHQTRCRRVVVLVRLDLEGARHRNPDGTEIDTPHIHLYKEGYGTKWAHPLPGGVFADLSDLSQTLDDFMEYCNITKRPIIRRRLL